MSNIEQILLPAVKLYKLTCGVNRNSAKSAGFYDGRFASKVQPTKKQGLHLKLRKEKHSLKREF